MVTKELQQRFEINFGQPGYSVYQINRMLGELRIAEFDTSTIREYAKRLNLIVDLVKEGMRSDLADPRYLIPESDLGTLMEGLGISVKIPDLEQAAAELGYRKK